MGRGRAWMGATEGSAARELKLFFYRVDAVDPSHPPARPSSDVSPIAGSSPTPLLNPPPAQPHHKRCCQSWECPQVQKAWAPNCLKWNIFQLMARWPLVLCGRQHGWFLCPKKTSIQGLTVTRRAFNITCHEGTGDAGSEVPLITGGTVPGPSTVRLPILYWSGGCNHLPAAETPTDTRQGWQHGESPVLWLLH